MTIEKPILNSSTGLDLVVSTLNLEPKKEYIKEIIGMV